MNEDSTNFNSTSVAIFVAAPAGGSVKVFNGYVYWAMESTQASRKLQNISH